MNVTPSVEAFGWLETWMGNKRNVIRFLVVRFIIMASMILAFSVLCLSHS
jgi:hypothetical protein